MTKPCIFLQSPPKYIKDHNAKDKNEDISTILISPSMRNKLAQFDNFTVITSPSRKYILANPSVISQPTCTSSIKKKEKEKKMNEERLKGIITPTLSKSPNQKSKDS